MTLIRCSLLSSFRFLLPSWLAGQSIKIDSLKTALGHARADSNKVHILNALSGAVLQSQPDRALRYGKEARALANRLRFYRGLTEAYYVIAAAYKAGNDIEEARTFFNKCMKCAENNHQEYWIARALEGLGNTASQMNDGPAGVGYFAESIRRFESINDWMAARRAMNALGLLVQENEGMIEQVNSPADVAMALSALAEIESSSDRHGRAIELLRRSLHIDETRQDSVAILHDLQSLAVAFQKMGHPDSTTRCMKKAFAMLERMQDSLRLANYWNDLGGIHFERGDIAGAAEQFQKSVSIYQALHNRDLICDPLCNLSNMLLLQGKIEQSAQCSHRLVKLTRDLNDASGTIKGYYLLGQAMAAGGRYDSAVSYEKYALRYAGASKDNWLLPYVYTSLGAYYHLLGHKDSALVYYQRGIPIARKHGDKNNTLRLCNNTGRLHFERGNLDEAMENFMEALVLAEETGDKYLVAAVQSNIGMIFFRQGYFEKALDYLYRSRHLGSKAHRMNVLTNIGAIHRAQGQNDSAFVYYNDALTLSERIRDRATQAKILTNLGDLHLMGHRLDSAEHCFNRALEMATAVKDEGTRAALYQHMGRIQRERGQYDSTIALYRQALDIATAQELPELVKAIAFDLGQVYAVKQDTTNSYAYFKLYLATNDSLSNKANRRIINELNTKYEVAEREKAILVLENSKQISDLEIQRQQEQLRIRSLEMLQQTQAMQLLGREKEIQQLELDKRTTELENERIATENDKSHIALLTKDNQLKSSMLERGSLVRKMMTGGLITFLLFLGVLSHRYRERKRMNTALSSTLEELQRTQNLLIHAEKMAALGQLSTGIAHEIRNPLNFITNFSTSSIELFEEYEETESVEEKSELHSMIVQNLKKITEHGTRADSIVGGMIFHSQTEAVEKTSADLHHMLDEAVESVQSTMMEKDPAFRMEIDKQFDPSISLLNLSQKEFSRAMQNIVDNACRAIHDRAAQGDATYSGTLLIQTERIGDNVRILIRDNGTGIPAAHLEKLFQPFYTTRPPGEGTGLGLTLCYEIIVNGHEGKISIDSMEGEYTACEVLIPAPERASTLRVSV